MKLLASLLITASLVLGVLAAATAYLPKVSLPDEAFEANDGFVTLNAPAGVKFDDEGKPQPLYKAGTEVTPEVLKELRDNRATVAGKETVVNRIRVKEFSLKRWPGKWFLGLAVAGLLAGAALIRSKSQPASAVANGDRAGEESPDTALDELRRMLTGLRSDLDRLPSERSRLDLIIELLNRAQKTHMPAFIDARPLLIARLGLSGFAALMDRYAAAERQINRAWSAAADGVYEESVECLELAIELLAAAIEKLTR